jgi:hypothetical protein
MGHLDLSITQQLLMVHLSCLSIFGAKQELPLEAQLVLLNFH